MYLQLEGTIVLFPPINWTIKMLKKSDNIFNIFLLSSQTNANGFNLQWYKVMIQWYKKALK